MGCAARRRARRARALPCDALCWPRAREGLRSLLSWVAPLPQRRSARASRGRRGRWLHARTRRCSVCLRGR
eukprot:scaffold1311_cov323-Prasinococcus_capsulatus_cf.AAC.5